MYKKITKPTNFIVISKFSIKPINEIFNYIYIILFIKILHFTYVQTPPRYFCPAFTFEMNI